jgi:hypothetical protein
VIGGDDHARQLRAASLGGLDDRGYVIGGRLAERTAVEFAGREPGGERREHVAAVESRADVAEGMGLDEFVAQAKHRRGGFLDDLGQQAVVGREEGVAVAERQEHAPVGADARIDHRQVHRAAREVVVGSRYPEAGFGRPVHIGFMGEIDDAGRRKAAHDHALHGADERSTMAEVGGHGDDAARLEMLAHVSPIAAHAPPLHCHGRRGRGAIAP